MLSCLCVHFELLVLVCGHSWVLFSMPGEAARHSAVVQCGGNRSRCRVYRLVGPRPAGCSASRRRGGRRATRRRRHGLKFVFQSDHHITAQPPFFSRLRMALGCSSGGRLNARSCSTWPPDEISCVFTGMSRARSPHPPLRERPEGTFHSALSTQQGSSTRH